MNEKRTTCIAFLEQSRIDFPSEKKKTGKRRIVEKNNSTTTKGCDANRKLRF